MIIVEGDDMSFTYRYRKQIILFFFSILVLSGGGIFIYQYSAKRKSSVSKKEVLLASKKEENNVDQKVNKEEKKEVYFKVDIKGEVVNPGLYSLKEGSRVSDVISMAGGLTANGDTSVVNLSKKIIDEMVIIIYSKSEVESFKQTQEVEKQVTEECQTHYEGIINDACISSNSIENTTVSSLSINTATVEELQTLPGIGEAKAKSIIQYREEHGEFKEIQELKNVDGIGDSIFDQIKDHITL